MFSSHPQFQPTSPEIEARISGYLTEMTLTEKLSMLGGPKQWGSTLSCERVGIPQFKMADGPVGVHWWCDASTAYPATIGVAASFNRDLAYRLGVALGRDCRARGVHYLLAPGVNIYRSPLCGRNFEYLGEDPYLSSAIVVQLVRGVQSQAVATTVKHYAVNYQEYDRHGVSSDVDERTLREIYLPAFEAAVREGGTGSIMTAYNLVNGQHCSEHFELVRDILKGEWGFEGVVMSDWTSTYDEVAAANAGLDLEMPWPRYLNPEKLAPAIEKGLVSEDVIDDKIRRQLRLAICFGWMDNEQKDATIPEDDPTSAETALQVARESCVLLKNDNDLLPLQAPRKIAVLGYQAHPAVICGGGSAYTNPFHQTSVLEGLESQVESDVEVLHAQAYDPQPLATAAARGDFRIPGGKQGAELQIWNGQDMQGRPDLVDKREKLSIWWGGKAPGEGIDAEDFSLGTEVEYVAQEDGGHTLHLECSGQLVLRWDGEAIVEKSAGREAGRFSRVDLDLEKGRTYRMEIEAHFQTSWNMLHVGVESHAGRDRMRQEALDAAREADAVVFCAGFSQQSEGEGHDRTFKLPAGQPELIRDVATENPHTCVLLFAGGGVEFSGWLENVEGLVHVWYPGQDGGKAIAEILLGKANPSGKLPATFDRKLEDRSSFDNYHDEDGDKHVRIRDGVFTGYRHNDREGIEPLFPFGYGLSYTSFRVENLRVSAEKFPADDGLEVTVDVTNTGDRAGAEVVQCYVGDLEASVPRPVKELKAFAKVQLEPGRTRSVTMKLDASSFAFWDVDLGGWAVESGQFEVFVGTSSREIAESRVVTALA
jgi:beta-glucosidase